MKVSDFNPLVVFRNDSPVKIANTLTVSALAAGAICFGTDNQVQSFVIGATSVVILTPLVCKAASAVDQLVKKIIKFSHEDIGVDPTRIEDYVIYVR